MIERRSVESIGLVGLVGLGSISVALVPACSGDDCQPGILSVAENAPSLTDRSCGAVDGESVDTALTSTCELADCVAMCPTLTPRNAEDVVTLVSCQHIVPGRPPAQPSSSASSSGSGGGGAALTGKPYFSCAYEIETLFCP